MSQYRRHTYIGPSFRNLKERRDEELNLKSASKLSDTFVSESDSFWMPFPAVDGRCFIRCEVLYLRFGKVFRVSRSALLAHSWFRNRRTHIVWLFYVTTIDGWETMRERESQGSLTTRRCNLCSLSLLRERISIMTLLYKAYTILFRRFSIQ